MLEKIFGIALDTAVYLIITAFVVTLICAAVYGIARLIVGKENAYRYSEFWNIIARSLTIASAIAVVIATTCCAVMHPDKLTIDNIQANDIGFWAGIVLLYFSAYNLVEILSRRNYERELALTKWWSDRNPFNRKPRRSR